MLFVFLALMEFALVNVLSRKKPKVEEEDVEMVRKKARKIELREEEDIEGAEKRKRKN